MCKCRIASFMEDVNTTRDDDFLLPFLNLDTILNNIIPAYFAYLWQIEPSRIIVIKFATAWTQFVGNVSADVTVIVA